MAGLWAKRVVVSLLTVFALATAAGCGGDSTAGKARPGPTVRASDGPGEGLPVLSDTGFGELKLGQSLNQAEAQGLVGEPEKDLDVDGCTVYRGNGAVELLYFAEGQLIIIVPSPKVRLELGVGVGDTLQDLEAAYGDRLLPTDGNDQSREYLTAPGAPFPAQYRIGIDTGRAFRDSKIVDIALQSVKNKCYE